MKQQGQVLEFHENGKPPLVRTKVASYLLCTRICSALGAEGEDDTKGDIDKNSPVIAESTRYLYLEH